MNELKKLKLIFQTLGDINRLKIIRFIGNGEFTVSEITEALKLSQPLISHHLKSLKQSGILSSHREGPFIRYRVIDLRLIEALNLFLEIFSEIDLADDEKRPFFPCFPMEPSPFMENMMKRRKRRRK